MAACLWFKEAVSHLLVQNFCLTDKILQEIMHFENVDSRRRKRIFANKSGAESSRKIANNAGVSSENKKESTRSAGSTNAAVRKCYRCGMSNHILKDCPSPKREIICYISRKSGHIGSRCQMAQQNKTETMTGEINLVSNTLRDKSFSKFIRQIQVGNSMLKAQIDMGASVCTIRASPVLNENFKLII